MNLNDRYVDESLREALHGWEDASDGDSEDAEHEAGLALADAVRAIVADYDLGKEQNGNA
jgi:hypothetical protein